MKVITDLHIKTYFLCPRCKGHEFYVNFILKRNQPFGPWTCPKCSQSLKGNVKEGEIELELLEVGTPTYVLLKLDSSEGPIFFITRGYPLELELKENYQHYYENYCCPSNTVTGVEVIVHKKSADPHGLFDYLGYVPLPPSHLAQDEGLDDLDYSELDELFNGMISAEQEEWKIRHAQS